jgi:hypothetical protein
MFYLTEARVRARAAGRDFGLGFEVGLALKLLQQNFRSHFDIFLSHAIRDAELILGVKEILEAADLTVYIDWIDDPLLDRARINGKTAETLRKRMKQSDSLL